jgi:hypothetical protein
MEGTGLFLCGEGKRGNVHGGCRVDYTAALIRQLRAAVAVLERERDEQETYADSLREKWDHNLAARGEGLLREKHLRERVRVLEARQAQSEALLRRVVKADQDDANMGHPNPGDSCIAACIGLEVIPFLDDPALRVLDADADTPPETPLLDPRFPHHVSGCICPRFKDIAPSLLADLTCPVHGVEGASPGDVIGPPPEGGEAA